MEPAFGLIGKKLGHSFSKKYFTEKFEREGIAERYELFELPSIDAFPGLLRTHPALRGLNVTIPYKTEVIPFLDALSPAAKAIGAVNTICIRNDRLEGHNTDIYGFHRSLESMLRGAPISHALVLGTGGAARAVAYVLSEKMEIPFTYVSRTAAPGILTYEALAERDMTDYLLIINTTPLGMYPRVEAAPQFPYDALTAHHYVYDLIYNPPETRFLRLASARGAHVQNGMDMLILQAEGAWKIWNEA
jgi:shikimate dehydrogenase